MAEGPEWYKDLVNWIEENGGCVHPSLTVRIEKDSSDGCFENRGIYASKEIRKGEVLVKLPMKLALCGRAMPHKYSIEKGSEEQRVASPWLRSLAALLIAKWNYSKSEICFGSYLRSLPADYDTLLHWNENEIEMFLSGTALGQLALQDLQNQCLQKQFHSTVLPYLKSLQQTKSSFSQIYEDFLWACDSISTRGFHLATTTAATSTQLHGQEPPRKQPRLHDEEYQGPFLLPFIDLINHSSDPSQQSTTLQTQDSNYFIMIAESKITSQTQIYHSYGTSLLTSHQLLHTFGFVERFTVQKAIERLQSPLSITNHPKEEEEEEQQQQQITPVLLSRQTIIDTCHHLATKSDYPQTLKQTMKQRHMDDDETWSLPTVPRHRPKQQKQPHDYEDVLLIQPLSSPDVLSDELITLCSLQFLPEHAYQELMADQNNNNHHHHLNNEKDHYRPPPLLDKSVLDDYFLGKLVLRSIVDIVDSTLDRYKPLKQYQEQISKKQIKIDKASCLHLENKGSKQQQQQQQTNYDTNTNNNNSEHDMDTTVLSQLLNADETGLMMSDIVQKK